MAATDEQMSADGGPLAVLPAEGVLEFATTDDAASVEQQPATPADDQAPAEPKPRVQPSKQSRSARKK